jgi:hypothetical protein
LLNPLHNIGQFLPVGGLDVKRERRPVKHKPAHLKGKNPFRVSERPAQKGLRPRQFEQGFADIHRCADLIPDVFA